MVDWEAAKPGPVRPVFVEALLVLIPRFIVFLRRRKGVSAGSVRVVRFGGGVGDWGSGGVYIHIKIGWWRWEKRWMVGWMVGVYGRRSSFNS